MANPNLLARLPRELRNLIYADLFFPNEDHVLVANDPQDITKPRLRLDLNRKNHSVSRCGYGLLAACKITHIETVPLCYPTVRFVLVDHLASNAWIKQQTEAGQLWMLKKVGLVILRRPDPREALSGCDRSSPLDDEFEASPIEARRIMQDSLAFTESLSFHVNSRPSLPPSDDFRWCTMFDQWIINPSETEKLQKSLDQMPALTKLTIPALLSALQVIIPNFMPNNLPKLVGLDVDTSLFLDEYKPLSANFGINRATTDREAYEIDGVFASYVRSMKNITYLKAPIGAWASSAYFRVDPRSMPQLQTLVLTNVWDVAERMSYDWHASYRNYKIRDQFRAIQFQFRDTLKSISITGSGSQPALTAGDDLERAEQMAIWLPLMEAIEGLNHLTHVSIVGQVSPNPSLWSAITGTEIESLELDVRLNGQWGSEIQRSLLLGSSHLQYLKIRYPKADRETQPNTDPVANFKDYLNVAERSSTAGGGRAPTWDIVEI